jgi:recombination protein RecA
MGNARLVREQVERTFSDRVQQALSLSPYVQPERMPCGIASLDALLHGGLPLGTLTEFVGSEGSGRTSVALAYMSAVINAGNVCAWIDVSDALDPETAAANGIDLERLLWVRCGSSGAHTPSALPHTENPQTHLNIAPLAVSQPRHTGGGSPHPRSEDRNMPQAISSMLKAHGGLYDKQVRRKNKWIGTPGAPNRPLTYRSEDREEQVNSDRLPPRRGDNLALASIAPRCAEQQPRRIAGIPSSTQMPLNPPPRNTAISHAGPPWKALDQALRAADLILQGGGFSAIVLDLGDVPPAIAWRIPLATWFRFRAACERSRVSLILLTQHPCARSSAELVVRLQTGRIEAKNKVMTGIHYHASIERSRSQERENRIVPIRKPPQSEHPGHWTSQASWARAQ